jgi:two-component system, response regulator
VTGITILVADDDPDDRLMVEEVLADHSLRQVEFVEDGVELMEYLSHCGEPDVPTPGLLLLDLNMPRKDGREALAEIKSDPGLSSLPVVVFTTSTAELDIDTCYSLGANSVITKPVTFERLSEVIGTLVEYWFGAVALPSASRAA